jgi:hypothetical protein
MATQKPRMSAMVRANELHQCSIPQCHSQRHSISQWCLKHASNRERNGDPLAVPVRSVQWKQHKAKVKELFNSNPDHAGLIRAAKYVDQWMEGAAAAEQQGQWALEIARLRRSGVSGLDVVTELCAAWALLQDQPRLCRSDYQRPFILSKAVLGLVPRPRRFTAKDNQTGGYGYPIKSKPSALTFIGQHLVQVLGAFLVNVHQNLSTEKAQAMQAVQELRAPFSVSSKAFTQEAKAATAADAL